VGPEHLRGQIPSILEDADNMPSPRMRTLLLELPEEWEKLEEQIDASTRELALFARKEEGCRATAHSARRGTTDCNSPYCGNR
jgi:hypothetical protein